MKVGDYLRNDRGKIGKITLFEGDLVRVDGDFITYKSYHPEIVKCEEKFIDLIEVGDYVNGSKVQEIGEGYVEIEEYSGLNNDIPCVVKAEDIKSIVTKEQFESMEYRIGE